MKAELKKIDSFTMGWVVEETPAGLALACAIGYLELNIDISW